MTQNTSRAVMQQRHEPHDSLDDFPTPPWATRALCERITCTGIVREPAANRGHMARPLGEYFPRVLASDIHDYGAGYSVGDYLFGPPTPPDVDWTITNPPFRLFLQFALRALRHSRHGPALFARIAILEGIDRHRDLFSYRPPNRIIQFVERVPICQGRLDPKGSTATAYCWLVWQTNLRDTRFEWIPPSRKRLERPGDYDHLVAS